MYDCTGSGDVDTSTIIQLKEGEKEIKVNPPFFHYNNIFLYLFYSYLGIKW